MALFNSGNNVNAIHLTFATEFGPSVRPTDIKAQNINGTMLNIYEIVVAAFLVTDKANRVIFFKKTFQVANISSKLDF